MRVAVHLLLLVLRDAVVLLVLLTGTLGLLLGLFQPRNLDPAH